MLGNFAVGITKEWMAVQMPHLPVIYIFPATLIVHQPLFNHLFVPFVKALWCVEKERTQWLHRVQVVMKQDVVEQNP